ncbi:MAG: retropepsin-like domain-containing protein [Deltaproteobacteria bacterium]|nr:retropepsin-like domain-containing protein [Deltaproteobacteria bacterium]MBW2382493.1 retropepsin-like domain-containing protein [Deltaproteobacteria bacterium]MBW2694974.1 retropepsin-like domain-containing protein [Deltaproteobacteria bacterium]
MVVLATLIGLGLKRGVPAGLALACALALSLLPILGLGVLLGGPRRMRWLVGAWLWSLALLAALPLYFPGERVPAAAAGTRWLMAASGEQVSSAAGDLAAAAVGLLGRDQAPVLPSMATAANTASSQAQSRPSRRIRIRPPEPEDEMILVKLPYEGDERSLRIKVDIDGPRLGEQFDMIFDTGATFTTLDERTLRALGLDVPVSAPRVTLQTANGRIEAPLVLVDAIWMGDEPVEWVTVAVCDSCANPPAVGLLGLNVSRQFQVSLDHDRKRIDLRGRHRAGDRQLDVAPWLEIHSEARRLWNGRIEVGVTGHNRARQEIDKAVVEVDCGGEAFAVALDQIPAESQRQTGFSLPRGTECQTLRVGLARARWLLDRF